jgi:hypothetical protein
MICTLQVKESCQQEHKYFWSLHIGIELRKTEYSLQEQSWAALKVLLALARSCIQQCPPLFPGM